MNTVLKKILTDKTLRSNASVNKAALSSDAFEPWNDAASK